MKPVIVAAAAITVLWFVLLAQRPLYEPDEGRYAEIPREMLAGDWVTPHLNGLVYLEKPPLQYWITALFYRVFGQSEATARLCTGIAGYLSLFIVFLVSRRLWGVEAGFRALLFCLGSALFVLMGHQLTLDMTLSFFLLLALACFLCAQSERRETRRGEAWMLGCWSAMALAVLTKGLIGLLIPGATLVIYVVWQRDWEALRRLNVRWGLPLFAVLALPWFVLAARANPQFLRFFFIREHFQRFLTPIEHRSEPWWFFLMVLGIGTLPWLPMALRALLTPHRSAAPRGEFDPRRVLWVWCVFVWAFFSCSDAKLIPYVLPLVPALAMLCAAGDAADERRELILGAAISLLACSGVLAFAGGFWTSASVRALAPEMRPVILWTAVLLGVIGASCLLLAGGRRTRAALGVLCLGWFLGLCTVLVAAERVQGFFSAKDAALALLADSRSPSAVEPVYAVQTYDQSLPFYLKRPVTLVDYRDEFTLGLSLAPERGIASLGEFSERWRSSSAGYAVMPFETFDELAARGLPMRSVSRYRDQILVSRQ